MHLISLTSACCKTLKRNIAARLYENFDSNRLFDDNQFGFRRGHRRVRSQDFSKKGESVKIVTGIKIYYLGEKRWLYL